MYTVHCINSCLPSLISHPPLSSHSLVSSMPLSHTQVFLFCLVTPLSKIICEVISLELSIGVWQVHHWVRQLKIMIVPHLGSISSQSEGCFFPTNSSHTPPPAWLLNAPILCRPRRQAQLLWDHVSNGCVMPCRQHCVALLSIFSSYTLSTPSSVMFPQP